MVFTVVAMGRRKQRTESLRTDMCVAAMQLLDRGGVSAVTTRAVAAGSASSMAAVNELFGGKAGLVRAMYAEGFRQLAEELAQVEEAGDPAESVLALAFAFRSFASRRRHLYEVMFSRPFVDFSPDSDDSRAAAAIYRIVLEHVTALVGASPAKGAGEDAAISLFAVVQGLVSIEFAGLLGSSSESIERRWRTAVTATMNGFAAGAPRPVTPGRS